MKSGVRTMRATSPGRNGCALTALPIGADTDQNTVRWFCQPDPAAFLVLTSASTEPKSTGLLSRPSAFSSPAIVP